MAVKALLVGVEEMQRVVVDEIEVEFSGDSAKLIWSVSIDGKKTE